MDKAKSMVDKKGASGPFHVNNGQSQKVFHSHVMVATNGSCCSSSSNAFGSSTVPSGSGTFENMHHLHRGDDAECSGSPAKRCKLRRRTESVRKHRPRKLIFFFRSDMIFLYLLSFVPNMSRVNAIPTGRCLHNRAVLQWQEWKRCHSARVLPHC